MSKSTYTVTFEHTPGEHPEPRHLMALLKEAIAEDGYWCNQLHVRHVEWTGTDNA